MLLGFKNLFAKIYLNKKLAILNHFVVPKSEEENISEQIKIPYLLKAEPTTKAQK